MGNNPIAPTVLVDGVGRVVAVIDEREPIIARLKERYALGEFTLEEFERRVDDILSPEPLPTIAPPTIAR